MGQQLSREEEEKQEQLEKDHEKYDKKYIIKEDGQQEDIFDISSDLVRFKNLRTLELDFNTKSIDNVVILKDGLLYLKFIESINFSFANTSIFNLDFLQECFVLWSPELTQVELNLANTKIRNIDIPLQGLCRARKLRVLNINLNETTISSVEEIALQNFEQLKCLTLEFQQTPIYEIDSFCGYLSQLQKLEELSLNLSFTKIKSLESVGKNLPRSLCALDLNGESTMINTVNELNLNKLVSLDALTLNFNDTKIQNVDSIGEAIQCMKELRYLRLQFKNTQINTIDHLCYKIGYSSSLLTIQLNLENTQIESIQPISNAIAALQKLEYINLNLRSTSVQDLEQFQKETITLKNLMTLILNVENTQVNNLEVFEKELYKLPLLKSVHLFIGSSKIKQLNIVKIEKMSRLRNFQLSFPNQPIKTIDEMCSGLSLLHRLMTLSFDLENSNVDDVSVLDQFLGNYKYMIHFSIRLRDGVEYRSRDEFLKRK